MLPNLPMGTIITVCMLLGLLVATPYALKKQLKPLPKYVLAWLTKSNELLGPGGTYIRGLYDVNWAIYSAVRFAAGDTSKDKIRCSAWPVSLVSRLRKQNS